MAKAIETLSGADETAFLTAINDAITTDPGTTRTAIGIGSLTPTLHTASPNNTVNALELAVTGGTTNTDLVLGPKGTGAFILGPEPDGTATGGNKRGQYAVDLQPARAQATQVASGSYSLAVGYGNVAGGTLSLAFGDGNNAQATYSIAVGSNNQTSSSYSNAIGNSNLASGGNCIAIGYVNSCTGNKAFAIGGRAGANRLGMCAHASFSWDNPTGGDGAEPNSGQAQYVRFVAANKTTTNSGVTLFLDGSSTRLTIPSGKAMFANVQIVGIKSDGTAAATYQRQVAIKNVGGTTSLVGTVNTIGTDEAASTSISITADDTNDALKIEVTGIASETWRWVAVVDGVEVAYGS